MSNKDKLSWKFDGDLVTVSLHLSECAGNWEPGARLIGNARAVDIGAIADSYLRNEQVLLLLRQLVTSDRETKEQFIARVNAVLNR